MAKESNERRLRIGQVCKLLVDEFPDVSISKLRFLQDKGIVQPERTSGGYRSYSKEDVEALRIALRMQRDEFMPLRVIKDELRRRITTGDKGSSLNKIHTPAKAGEAFFQDPQPTVSVEALLRSSGVSVEFLEECRKAGIVKGRVNDAGQARFTRAEVELMSVAASLHRLGLDVRHLRQAAMVSTRYGAIVEQYGSAILRAPGNEQHERALKVLEKLTSELSQFMHLSFLSDVKDMVERTSNSTLGKVRV